ncbi:MAG: hypothetical protein K2Q23_19515 [Bryobacteraceae bacterium]|nr:hypothetical protein [Bryobacteraceae bacterium]
MQKVIYGSLTAFALFLAGRWVYHEFAAPEPVRAIQAIQPFTMGQEIYSFQRAVGGELTARRTLARRADGSEAEIDVVKAGSGGEFQILRKLEFADGRGKTFIESINAKLSGFVDRKRLDRRLLKMTAPPRDCIQGPERVVGKEVLFGHEFLVLEGSDDRAKRKSWQSPALGCVMTQMIQEEKNGNGQWVRTTQVVLTRLAKGEPEAQYFADGDQYKEMTPTQAYLEEARKRGVDPESCAKCKESVWELEKQYWLKQAPPSAGN